MLQYIIFKSKCNVCCVFFTHAVDLISFVFWVFTELWDKFMVKIFHSFLKSSSEENFKNYVLDHFEDL